MKSQQPGSRDELGTNAPFRTTLMAQAFMSVQPVNRLPATSDHRRRSKEYLLDVLQQALELVENKPGDIKLVDSTRTENDSSSSTG